MKLSYKYILFIFLLVGLASCNTNEPEHEVEFNLNLCLPAEKSAHYGPRHALGDPGTVEVFALPRYAYIFIMKQEGETWSVWQKEELFLNEEKWESTNYEGLFTERGDGIYKYSERIRFLLNNETPKGRVYVVCSNKRLTLSPSLASILTMDNVLNLKFNVAPDSIRENLRNIYSTPYNYQVNGKYYCSYDCSIGNTFTLDLLMYHVAAKVDITWNVSEEMRIKANPAEAVRLTFMEVRHLFDDYAYCFKPMRNELAAIESEGYSIEDIVTESDESLWWEGRYYFYTIPYVVTGAADAGKVYYPLQMVLKTNGSAGTGYQPTLNMQVDTSAVFVPWMRAMFNLTQPLANETDTKTVNLPTP